MSTWGAQQDPGGDEAATAGASWRALSGEALPQVPSLGGVPQQPLQDEHGAYHYPYGAQQPPLAPPYAGAEQLIEQPQPDPQQYVTPAPVDGAIAAVDPASMIVAPEQLAPVGPPRYLAPQRAVQDPRQRTLAAVIVFVCLLIALWAILAFMSSLSSTLASIANGNDKLTVQLAIANKGLEGLEEKTTPLEAMSGDAKVMGGLLKTIDSDMATMLEGVDEIAVNMASMEESLATLDEELATVNEVNASMSSQLAGINEGLKSQVASVRAMRRDVQATGGVLGTLDGRLAATNGRLAYVNQAVNIMGCRGITNNLKVKISLGPIPNGSATVFATVVPPGAWGTKEDGVTPC